MNTPKRPRMIPFFSSALVVTMLALAFTPGCKKHSPEDGHDHGAKGQDSHAEGHGQEHSDGAHPDEVTLTPDAVTRYGVKVEPAQLWQLRPTLIAPARIGFNTDSMAHVGSPLRGRAVEIKVKLGDTVKRGDPLIVVESPELGEAQAEYFQRRTAAQSSAPAVELAKNSWERAKTLNEQSQGISLTEVQKREAEYKAAVAGQKSADAAVIGAESRLRLLGMSQEATNQLVASGEIAPRYTVAAPIDGQVIQREITLGELVSPDREAVMVLADTGTLWVLADVSETRLHEVSRGARAWVTLGASEAGAKKLEGQVAFVAPFVDSLTRTAQVRIEVSSDGLTLKPGMFALVEIVASSGVSPDPAPCVAVPEEAVQTVEGGPALFVPVKGEPNTYAKRAVGVGKPVGGLVPILSGLVEGEEFVAAGTFILKAELGKGSAAHEH